jgi:hypothetical protein
MRENTTILTSEASDFHASEKLKIIFEKAVPRG